MPAVPKENELEGTEKTAFCKEKLRNGMEADENAIRVLFPRTARCRTHFEHGYYAECSLEGGGKWLSRSLMDLRMERASESVPRNVYMRNIRTEKFSEMQYLWMESKITKEAGIRVTHLLMLHSWRCRRLNAEKSLALINELNNQVGTLNLQVYALRQLLEYEKTRRNLAVKRIYTDKEESERKRNLILKEKEMLECKVRELLEFKDESENQKNNFEAAKREAEIWKKRSLTLKDKNLILEQKTQEKENQVVQQTRSLTELKQGIKKLEEELHAKALLLKQATEQIISVQEKLKLSEELGKKQERFLMEKNEEINQLRAQIALMEEKLQEQDERNGELGKLISDKTKELVLLHDKLGELTKNQRFWGNRVIQMASMCTRIPIACFYTVATLLLPQPSYRSILKD